MMHPLMYLVDLLLDTTNFLVFIYVLLTTLVATGILNPERPFIASVLHFLSQILSPPLDLVKKYIPYRLHNIDLSPIILGIILHFLSYTIHYYFD